MSHREVSESGAEGKIKAVFEDIKATLAMPTVGSVFRRLAGWPWYLQLSWRNLKPNAETAYFHRSAAETRDWSTRSNGEQLLQSSYVPPSQSIDRSFQDAVATLVDVSSKLLVAAAALREGTAGQLPKMHLISSQDKRRASELHTHTVPTESTEHKAEPQEATSHGNQVEAQRIITNGLLGAGQTELGILLRWPNQLTASWNAVSDTCEGARFDRLVGELRQEITLMVEALPFRMEISATACRQAGLTDDQIEAVRNVIEGFWDTLPTQLLRLCALQTAMPAKATPEEVAAALT